MRSSSDKEHPGTCRLQAMCTNIDGIRADGKATPPRRGHSRHRTFELDVDTADEVLPMDVLCVSRKSSFKLDASAVPVSHPPHTHALVPRLLDFALPTSTRPHALCTLILHFAQRINGLEVVPSVKQTAQESAEYTSGIIGGTRGVFCCDDTAFSLACRLLLGFGSTTSVPEISDALLFVGAGTGACSAALLLGSGTDATDGGLSTCSFDRNRRRSSLETCWLKSWKTDGVHGPQKTSTPKSSPPNLPQPTLSMLSF